MGADRIGLVSGRSDEEPEARSLTLNAAVREIAAKRHGNRCGKERHNPEGEAAATGAAITKLKLSISSTIVVHQK